MDDKELLTHCYHAMYQGMIGKDMELLGESLDESFVLVHMTGMHQTKNQYMDYIANGTLNYYAEGDYRNFMPQYKAEAMDANRGLMEYIRSLAAEKQATPAQISLAWIINKKPYIVPIPGSKKAERIRENAGAAEIELTTQEVTAIDEKLDHMEIAGVYGASPARK